MFDLLMEDEVYMERFTEVVVMLQKYLVLAGVRMVLSNQLM